MAAGAHPAARGAGDIGLLAGLVGLLLLLMLVSLAVGPAGLTLPEVVQGLVAGDGVEGLVIRDIRLPRTLLAAIVGATLGIGGAALQGLLRNPLADPGLFGAPQAAALGAVIVLYAGLAGALSFALPAAAIAGAALSVMLVVTVAGRDPGITVLLLAGLAVSSLAGAGTSVAINLSSNPFAITEIVFWLLGSFEDRSFRHVLLAAPFAVASWALILSQGEALRALTLGDEAAESLGVPVARVRLLLVAAVAVGVGACVAVTGAIGFVGLVAPHLVRGAVGADPRRVLVPSALAGAALTLAADIATRLIPATTELKVGALTAIIGVPFFLWIVSRSRGMFGGAPA
ncbi:FecCD family ABC transporter permease [Alsobacter sp. R-9]